MKVIAVLELDLKPEASQGMEPQSKVAKLANHSS